MRNRLIGLRERRAQLVERARAERERLGVLVSRAEQALSWIEAGRRAFDEARRRPLVVLACAALLAAMRPRRALKLLASGWSLWQLYRRLRGGWRLAAPLVASVAAHRP
jgi:hypothetical protein